jgi:DNA-binding CsgD family transcriptional regulator
MMPTSPVEPGSATATGDVAVTSAEGRYRSLPRRAGGAADGSTADSVPSPAKSSAAVPEVKHVRSGPLTPRELEVADLVAAGLTNREIAQSLVISTRTVESHIEHIKVKLGFTRRARIVAWALECAYYDVARRQTNPRDRDDSGRLLP